MRKDLLPLLALLSSCNFHPKADLVVTNAVIWTANDFAPRAEAMAIQGDSLVAVGSANDIKPWISSRTRVIDAGGGFVTPGYIDCHVHFLTGGMNLASVQLRDAKTPAEFIVRIRDFAAKAEPATWILGGDWDHENWGGVMPARHWIDSVSNGHPIFLNRLDGHMALANSLALEAAGINSGVKDVAGGAMDRDKKGALTGIFRDNAMNLIYSRIPPATPEQEDRALDAAMAYVASKGVTSVHHMDGNFDVFSRAREQGRLKTRVYANMPLSGWEALAGIVEKQGKGDKWVRIGGLKGFVDGSLGSHTAAFLEPFTDAPGDRGFFITPESDLYRWIKKADSAKLQVMVHAIGDRAIHTLLNIYEKVMYENDPWDRRFRIEHNQHVAPADLARYGKLRILTSMQPYHAIDDGRWAVKVIGPARIKTTYAFRSLIDEGALMAFGSDWFVAPPTPLEGIYAAVTRRTLDGAHPGGWVPEQKITVEEALKAYTLNAAYASHEEKIKGSLQPGKLADFVIHEANLLTLGPEKIKDVKVKLTVVGGQVVYEAPLPD
jgi:hypothetical protein